MTVNGDNKLSGKTALVTGAGRRLGYAIATTLAGQGVNIVIHYPDDVAETNALKEELQRIGVKSWLIKADFAKTPEYETLISRALEAAESLDFLINNASIFGADTINDITFAELNRYIQINAWAPFVLSRDFAKQAGSGKIINILDTKIAGSDETHLGYILSKQMLASFTRITALDFAPDFTVNAVAPGLILPPPGKDEKYLNDLAQALPLQRHGDPVDVSSAVLYLLQNNFITGQTIYVDGGRHIRE
jgi:pteridine reductase